MSDVMIVIGFLLGLVAIIFVIWLTVTLIQNLSDGTWVFGDFFLWHWLSHWIRFKKFKNDNNLPCFSYRQIMNFYNTAPTKWHIENRYHHDYKHSHSFYKNFDVIMYLHDGWTCIGTKSMLDYLFSLRYINNAKKKEQERKNTFNRSVEMSKLVMSFSADAKNAQNEANRLIKEQEETVSKILANLSQTEQAGN